MKAGWLAALALLTGCATVSSTANFLGTSNPVLLGPTDRVRSGAGPRLAATRLRGFETEAFHSFVQQANYGGVGLSSTTSYTTDLKLDAAAQGVLGLDRSLDIRVTDLNPKSRGNLMSLRVSVLVEGEVVRVGGAP